MQHFTLRVDTRNIGEDTAKQFGETVHVSNIDDLCDALCDAFEAHLGRGTAPHREMITHLMADLRANGLTVGGKHLTTFGRPSRPYVFFTIKREADILTDSSVSV